MTASGPFGTGCGFSPVNANLDSGRGSNRTGLPPSCAHPKGSGWGIVRFDTRTRTAVFEMWRYLEGQFEGFPRTMSFA